MEKTGVGKMIKSNGRTSDQDKRVRGNLADSALARMGVSKRRFGMGVPCLDCLASLRTIKINCRYTASMREKMNLTVDRLASYRGRQEGAKQSPP